MKDAKPRKGKFGLAVIMVLVVVILAVVLRIKTGPAAIVNGQAISVEELEYRYNALPAQFQAVLSKEAYLDQLVEEYLLLGRAKELGITVSNDEVKAKISQTMAQLGLTSEDIAKGLEEQGITQDEFAESLRIQLIVEKLFTQEAYQGIEVTSNDVVAYFRENQDQFAVEEQIRASHILISNQNKEDAVAKAVAESLLKGPDIKEDFAAVAAEHSEDPGSRALGGDLGFFSRGQMVAPFEEVAFKLDIGELSRVVKTQFGYHIILVTEKKEAGEPDFATLEDPIREALLAEKQQQAVILYLGQLRRDSEIKVLYSSDVVKVAKNSSSGA